MFLLHMDAELVAPHCTDERTVIFYDPDPVLNF